MAEVTTGNQLNAYEGNANLAGEGGSAVGYAKADLTPLENYAIRRYDTNLRDYNTQQAERAKLEQQYMDPAIYVNLDKGLADQISPKLDRFKQLAKMQLEKNPNSNEYYEFKNLYADITKDNAKAKAVQTLKDQYKNAMGLSQDRHEKERMAGYIGKLDNYKLGEDIPVYNKYFAFDNGHLPIGHEITGTVKRLNGDKIQTVKTTISNPMGLDEEAKRQYIANPKVATTGEDIGHSLVEDGGIEELNAKAKEYAVLGKQLNKSLLLEKYQPQFAEFRKANPTGTAKEFILTLPGGAEELAKIDAGHKYLEEGVKLIDVPAGQPRLRNYTYTPDGTKMLSVDNDTLRALFKATDQPVGKTEQILNEELSKTPAEIALLNARVGETKAKTNAANALAEQRRRQAALTGKKASILDKQYNPAETWNELWKGEITTETTGNNNTHSRINAKQMSKEFLDNLGIDPINKEGDFNIVPTNIKFKGKSMSADEVYGIYNSNKDDVKKLTDKLGHKPDIFEFMFANGVEFGQPEIVGKVRPIYKNGKKSDGTTGPILQNPDEAGKVVRSNKLQSWSNQRKGLKVTGDKLLMEENNSSEGGEGDNSGDINAQY